MPTLLLIAMKARAIAGSAASWLVRNPWVAGCLLLAATTLWERHEATSWHTVAIRDEAALKAVPAAQAKALAAQKAVDAQFAAKSANDAKVSDDDPQTAILDAVAQYAAAHRVRPPADCRGAGVASAPAPGDAAPVDHGPGAGAIVLSEGDYAILNGNTERLLKAHAFAEKAIADGVAVPEAAAPAVPK